MKVYESNGRDYMVFVKVHGNRIPVRFHDMGAYDNKGIFVTDNAEIASALERHPRFNQFFFLKEGELDTVPQAEEDKHVYHKVYGFVNRTQAAIEVLVKEYGIKRTEVKTINDVLRKAMDLNISFPKLEERNK